MALAVSLSRFTSRVGGGSAFYVRPHMPTEHTLPPELTAAAQTLERQIQSLAIPSQKIPLTEWDSLAPKVRSLIPRWLMELLANHSLAYVALERPHEIGEWERYFSFWPPHWYAGAITPDDPVASRKNGWWLTKEFIEDGFIPLSNESDGDYWLISITGGPTSPVYLFDLSGRKRIVASKNMAEFLASFKISKNQD